MEKAKEYLQRRAERWVSTFVLVGCVLITAALVYTARQTEDLGNAYRASDGHDMIYELTGSN